MITEFQFLISLRKFIHSLISYLWASHWYNPCNTVSSSYHTVLCTSSSPRPRSRWWTSWGSHIESLESQRAYVKSLKIIFDLIIHIHILIVFMGFMIEKRFVMRKWWETNGFVTAVVHLYKVQQTAKAPRNRVQPLRTRIGPTWVDQLRYIPIWEIGAATVGREGLLGDVAGREVSHAKKVTGAFDVTLLLRGKGGKARRSQALLCAFPPLDTKLALICWIVPFLTSHIFNQRYLWNPSSLEDNLHGRWV